jgi:hypothetical protein
MVGVSVVHRNALPDQTFNGPQLIAFVGGAE